MGKGVCVITGGSRGIGAASALLAGRNGWDVLINYKANAAAAAAVADKVRAEGVRAETVGADVAHEPGVLDVFAAADAMGPTTALVNNAGFAEQVGILTDFSANRIQRIVQLNVVGAILVAREAVKRMATRFGGSGGAIVNLSSASAKLGSPGQFVDYAATKGAVDSFTIGLALEWARDGIRVNAVRPGIIDTEFQAAVGVPDRPKTHGPQQPLGRAGTAEEVAEAILWLMSDASRYTTASFVDVSGGRIATP